MNISAAIIAKNSQDTLEYLFLSLKGICNQIVFVDTGSNDETPIIATRMGAEVYFYKWNNNFSDARNYALKFVRNEWVLVIDTDEILSTIDLDQLEQMINENPKIGGINLIIKNYLNKEDLDQYSIHRYTRLFRKHSAIYFTGKIHEQVRPQIEAAGFDVVDLDFVIEHLGYMHNSPEKHSRNLELLSNEIEQNQHDVFLKYHLAQTEFSLSNTNRARELFEQIIDSPMLSDEQNAFCRIRLGQIYLRENNIQKAEFYLNKPISDENLDGFRLFVLAGAKMQDRKFEEAYKLYQDPKLITSTYIDKSIVLSAIDALKQILK